MPSVLVRRLPAALACLALVTGLLAVAAPAQATGRVVTGTILGSDGRAVDAFLGFDLKDSSNRTIDANGCLATTCGLHGYGIFLRLNGKLGATGSTDRTHWATTWSITAPANAAHVYIEVYPFAAGTYGKTDESRYGHSYRRNLSLPYGMRINLRLPLICSAGGTTGAISGHVTVGGAAATLQRAATWSLHADNNGPTPILGWNIGSTGSGTFRLPNLASGQTYQVLATTSDGRTKHYYGVPVNSCRTTTLNVAF